MHALGTLLSVAEEIVCSTSTVLIIHHGITLYGLKCQLSSALTHKFKFHQLKSHSQSHINY